MKNEIQLKGHLKFTVRNLLTDKVIQKFNSHNVIVNSGVINILNGLAGNNFKTIAKFAVGTGNNAESITNTSLTDKFTKNVSNTTVEEDKKSVTFNFQLNSDEYNGKIINEMGLFLADNTTLFSRRTIAVPIEKNEAITLSGSWTITLNQE